MSNDFRPELDPTAKTRIEHAREKAKSFALAASGAADRAAMDWLSSRAQPDPSDLMFANSRMEAPATEGQMRALGFYFDVMSYEHFLINPKETTFKAVLEDLAAEAKRVFPLHSDVLGERKRQWIGRASGRTTISAATFERVPQSVWHDLRVEFGRLDGADLRAVMGADGWWAIDGGPQDQVARRTLHENFFCLVRRAVAALGFRDRSVAVEVWLDALQRDSSHSIAWGVDRLCLACADYCLELERRSTESAVQSLESTSRRVRLDLADPETRKRRREMIRQSRKVADLSMKQIAARFRVTVPAIYGMVTGDRSRFSEQTRLSFLQALEIDPAQW